MVLDKKKELCYTACTFENKSDASDHYIVSTTQKTGESFMAFGDKTKQYKDNAARSNGTGADGEGRKFDSQWIPTGGGTVIFRPLQDVQNGELVLVQRQSPSGKPLFEGGKKNGTPMMAPQPAAEVVFLFAWWEVNVGGTNIGRPIMLDVKAGGDVNTAKFKNPLWEHIQKNFPQKDSRERKAIKLQFALNVWDMTPVMRNDEGLLFYPAEDKTWSRLAAGNNGKLIAPNNKIKLPQHYKMDLEDALEAGHAVPLNKIRILQGSYGKPASEGGKHLFSQFEMLLNTYEDGDGVIRNLGEFDLRLTTTGEGLSTQRAIRAINRFTPLPKEANFGTRYDLESWTTPWPDEAVEELIEGRDYNEVVEEYKLVQFPSLFETEESKPADTTQVATEDSEEGLFDD